MNDFLEKLTKVMDKYEKFFPVTKFVDGDLNKMLIVVFGYIAAVAIVIGLGFIVSAMLGILGKIWAVVNIVAGIYSFIGIIYAIMSYVNRYNF